MRKGLISLAAALLAAGSTGCVSWHATAATPEQQAVMVPVQQFIDGFNAGDVAKAIAACADDTAIIDEFPPHEWHGPGAMSRWVADYEADARKKVVTEGIVTPGVPRYIDVAGDRAYVVLPADYAFKVNGKPVAENGSMMTLALQKGAAGWRITAWAWTRN